jgi:hypothetical protein
MTREPTADDYARWIESCESALNHCKIRESTYDAMARTIADLKTRRHYLLMREAS